MPVEPEEIDKEYLNYYKDYKDGINDSQLDRFRTIVSRRQQEREKAAAHQVNLTLGRGRTIKYRTPFSDIQESSIHTSFEEAIKSPRGRDEPTGHCLENGSYLSAKKPNLEKN